MININRLSLKNTSLPLIVFITTAFILLPVQLFMHKPFLLAERLHAGLGFLQVFIAACYAAFIAYQMQDPKKTAVWRKRSWLIFSIFFFSQLLAGIFINDIFLMSGKLHLPIPALIIGGPIYRGEWSIMTILFLSTVLISGPAWCSHLCYFGAWDSLASRNNLMTNPIKNLMTWKHGFLFLVIVSAIGLRIMGASNFTASIAGISFGLLGITVMIIFSRKTKKMLHCIAYCPVGTLIMYLKKINPFNITINNSCIVCMNCSKYCKYEALSFNDIKNKKVGSTCTYCGDCIRGCEQEALEYKFFSLSPKTSRRLYLAITISLHAATLAMARI